MPLDLIGAIDRLYQAPLDRFVVERDGLAKELRAQGNRDAAAAVKRLAKPSVTAWAVNQAWWGHEASFRAMLDAGQALREAQEAALRGRKVDLRKAIEARQRAVDSAADAAFAALGGPAQVSPDAHRRIVSTLDALATSGVPSGVKLGRLTEDLASTGLDVLSALAASLPAVRVEKGRGAATPQGPAAPKRAPKAAARKAAETRAAARAAAREAERERKAREAEKARERKEAARREAAEKKAAARVAAIEAELARARRELERLKG